MDELVSLLQQLDDSSLPDGDIRVILHDCHHDLISAIRDLATSLLISDKGDPIFEEMDRLYNDYGYFILPADRTKHGMAIGCLKTKKGLILFG